MTDLPFHVRRGGATRRVAALSWPRPHAPRGRWVRLPAPGRCPRSRTKDRHPAPFRARVLLTCTPMVPLSRRTDTSSTMSNAPQQNSAGDLAPLVAGRPRVFCCHRATLSGRYPPNSLPAVAECVQAGAPRVEIDVRFLADDGMVVLHDAELDEDTTGSGPVAALDSAAARGLRFRRDDSVGVATLSEVVDLLRGSETLLQVDLKLTRGISAVRARNLAEALAPVRSQVLVGSQAYWNLRPLSAAGYRVALDPTLQWHYFPGRRGDLYPARLGLHGLWDDAPLAHIPGVEPVPYLRARVEDLLGLLPASEWMVDYATIRYLRALGLNLGEVLQARGVDLAAWTVKDEGRDSTGQLLQDLFALAVTTVISDAPVQLASYVTREVA